MEEILSNKGGLQLCLDGFMYTKHSTRKSSIWWKCTWRSSHQRRGSLKTNLQKENPQVGQPHNHPPNQNQVQLAKVRLAMKRQATETRDKPSQILAQTVTQCEDEIKAMLPTASTCARTIRKQRPTPVVPQHLAELGDLLQDSTLTLGPNPEPFLVHDNGSNRHDCILVFGATSNLRLLAEADTFYMDGNFSMAPGIFKQVHVIHVPLATTFVTAVYALLLTKTRAIYKEVFQAVVDNVHSDLDLEMNVQTIVTDFEDAVLRLLR